MVLNNYHFLHEEIPDFLRREECEHLIHKAKDAGLTLSEVRLPEESNHRDKFSG